MAKIDAVDIPKLLFTEGAAPGTPASGKVHLYAKADGLFYSKDDAGVETVVTGGAGAGAVPTELDYTEFTATVTPTATTEATANTVVTAGAETLDGSTKILIEFFCPNARADVGAAGRDMKFWLYDGASSIGQIALVSSASTTGNRAPIRVARRLTPSAASHTYSIRASVSAGTGQVNAGAGGAGNEVPGFIRITTIV